MEREELEKRDAMKMVGTLLMKASGADILPPPEIKETALRALGLTDNALFEKIQKDLNKVHPKEKVRIIHGLLLTELKMSQLTDIPEIVQIGIKATLGYLADHPEYRKRPKIEDLLP